MAGKIRKLTSLAIAFTVVCLAAASFPQFNVLTPAPVMASAINVVPNLQHANDTTGDFLSGITGDDATEDPDTLGSVDTGDNVYTVDKGKEMHFDTFDVSSIPDGSTINAAVLHLQYGGEDGYTGTNPVNYDNGGGLTTTGITPSDITGWSADLTFDLYNAGVDTKTEIQNVDIEFDNNDPAKPGAVNFDYLWITVTYTIVAEGPASQGITISDGVTITTGAVSPVSQGITISDGVTTAIVVSSPVSQGITLTDGVTAAVARARDASQDITISDGVTVAFDGGWDASQDITISDGVTVAFDGGWDASQDITISDGVTAAIDRGRNISQGITISDGVTVAFDGGWDASQDITISDGVTVITGAFYPVSQGITISDGVTVAFVVSSPVSQGITISDGVTTAFDGGRDASQGITISDGATAIIGAVSPASQGITISDGVTAAVARAKDVSQDITISDGVTATVTTPTPTPPPPGGGGGGAPPPPPPAPPLPPGTTDVSGFVSADGTFTETVVIESVDGECELTINEGTTGLSGEGDPLAEIAVTEMEDPPAPPENSHIIGLTYDLGPEGATFTPAVPDEPAVTITWSYDPDTLPEGVTEENMVLAYYDEDAGEWVELPSIVDTVNHTITASVSHFTTFAIIARAVPPEPATFSLSNLSIQPAEVQSEEAVTITVLVANTGGMEGSHTVVLKIEGVEETEKNVTVAAGDSQSVSFTVSREDAGSYSVVMGKLSGNFTIVALPAPPVAPALNWPLLGGAAAALWGLLIFLGRRKISPLTHAALPKLRALGSLLVAVRLKIAPFTRRMISYLACTAWPKLRALGSLLVAVRLKIAPFTRRMISSLANTAWPKFRALIALLVAVRLKIAPFTRRIISSFAYTAWPKLRALVALLMAVRLKIAPFTRHMISYLVYTAWPKLRAFIALLGVVRLKIAPFTRRIISSFAYTAWPKLRAFIALLGVVRLKIAPFTRRMISYLVYTAWPKLRALAVLLVAVRLKIAPFIRCIISSLISRVKH